MAFTETPPPVHSLLTNPAQAGLRQYGQVPPVLAADNIPSVSATTGLGTGGGASCQAPSNGGFGTIFVQAGSNPSTGGTVALTFPDTPPTLAIAGSPDSFGTLSQATVGNVVTITWTAKPQASALHKISYGWASSY